MAGTDKRTREARHIGPKQTGGVGHTFTKAANKVSEAAGNHWTFVLMVLLIAG